VRTDRTSASGGGGVDADDSDYSGPARATEPTATTIDDDDAGEDEDEPQNRRSVLRAKPGQGTDYAATQHEARETSADDRKTDSSDEVDL
jgi:hypothetical protein